MNHKRIQRKLILFLDSELSGTETDKIKQHLEECSSCSKELEKIAHVWKFEEEARRIDPPPYLLTRLNARIKEYETYQHPFTELFKGIIGLVRPAIALMILTSGILLGVYLGNIPLPNNARKIDIQTTAQERERFFSSIYLDSFQDLPPESVGGVYVAITAPNEKGGDE